MAVVHNQHVTRTRTGLLIIRAWVEPGSSSPLRAQIRLTTDVSRGFDRSRTISQEAAVLEAVQAWLSALLDATPGADDDVDNKRSS
jgi:hypothetical protein